MPEFILAYSLGKVGGVPTSRDARRAFKVELAKRWRSSHIDHAGVMRRLPETTVIGDFPDRSAAMASIKAAKTAGLNAEPGPFALTRHVLSKFTLEDLTGEGVPPAPVTKAGAGLQRLRLKPE